MNIEIRFSTGCYDWAHPTEKQDLAHIILPCLKDPLNISVKEGEFDDLRGQDWSEAIPEALERYINRVWIATALPKAKQALEWCKSPEGQYAIQKIWVEKELKFVRDQIDKLEQRRLNLIKIQERLI